MKPFLVSITRLSGSVKLRCALSLGSAVTGLDLRPGRPLPPSPEPSSSGFEAALGFGGSLGFGFQRGLGGTDLLEPLLFIGHPLGHLLATLRCSQLAALGPGGLGRLHRPPFVLP